MSKPAPNFVSSPHVSTTDNNAAAVGVTTGNQNENKHHEPVQTGEVSARNGDSDCDIGDHPTQCIVLQERLILDAGNYDEIMLYTIPTPGQLKNVRIISFLDKHIAAGLRIHDEQAQGDTRAECTTTIDFPNVDKVHLGHGVISDLAADYRHFYASQRYSTSAKFLLECPEVIFKHTPAATSLCIDWPSEWGYGVDLFYGRREMDITEPMEWVVSHLLNKGCPRDLVIHIPDFRLHKAAFSPTLFQQIRDRGCNLAIYLECELNKTNAEALVVVVWTHFLRITRASQYHHLQLTWTYSYLLPRVKGFETAWEAFGKRLTDRNRAQFDIFATRVKIREMDCACRAGLEEHEGYGEEEGSGLGFDHDA